jgi:hypothetical protein
MYTIHHPQPVQLPLNTYAGRDSLYNRSSYVNDQYPPIFEDLSLTPNLQKQNVSHSRSLSSIRDSAHPELKVIPVDELYHDSSVFREYIADHESSLTKFGVLTDALSEVFEAGKRTCEQIWIGR